MTTQTDWSQYEVKDNELENTPIEENNFEFEKPVNWNKYLEKQDETLFDDVKRFGARTASRIGETLAGMPGDVVNLVKWIDSKMPDTPKILKKEPNFIQNIGKDVLEKLPSSGELKEKMSEISSGYTDPQGALEEFGDSITELATVLLTSKNPTKIKNVLSSIAKATGAKTARKTTELLGGGEKTQLATEFGSLFLMGLIGKKSANAYVSDQYKQARGLIPEGTMIATEDLMGELESLESELSKGISTPTKSEVKGAVSELKAKVSGGAYPVEELVDVYHDINERMSSKKLFDELSSTERKKLKFRYDNFKDKVSDEIKKYGKDNPEFLKEWNEANLAYKAIEDSKKVTHFLERYIGKLPAKVAGSIAIELFLAQPQAAGATATSFAGLKMGELLHRIGSNKSLRKHYMDTIKAAMDENVPAFIKSISSLDNGLKNSITKVDKTK